VAINYFPTEEPDAGQVIDLIKAEELKGLAIPGDIRDEKFCRELVGKAVEGLRFNLWRASRQVRDR
jgi:hypothetical protein